MHTSINFSIFFFFVFSQSMLTVQRFKIISWRLALLPHSVDLLSLSLCICQTWETLKTYIYIENSMMNYFEGYFLSLLSTLSV